VRFEEGRWERKSRLKEEREEIRPDTDDPQVTYRGKQRLEDSVVPGKKKGGDTFQLRPNMKI